MSVIVTETADSPVVDGSQLPPTSVPSKTGEPRQSPLHGSEIHGTLARDVRLCAQFHHEGQQIFSRRAFCFELNGRDWRQIFGASRFTCLDPFSIFLLRLGFCIPMVGVSVWDIMTSFPYVYFTTWTNFLAAVHSCVALCSSVATLVSLSRDYDKRVTDQKESLEKVRGSCPGECAVTVRGAKVQNDSESPKSSKARCWVFNFLRLPSRTREVYRRLLSDPALCRDGVIFVPGHLSSSSRKCGKDVSPLPVNQTQLVHPSGMTGVDTSSRTPSPEVVVGLNFSDFPLVQEHETQEAHHQGAPGKVSTVKSTVWERVSAFIIFGTSMTGITASLITVTLFWCVLVPTGTPFKRPVHVACHSLCLISSFLICFTGRVPFLLYHAWFLLSVGLAYTAVNVAVYLVPIRVGKQVGYIYKIFNFPSHPLQAWLSFVFVATIGLCIAAVIPWLFLWKANTRFDPPSSRAEVSRPRGK
ncbi:hypothetical protein CSUI_003079 [Cystoisospora suis]|uniref:Transmembrane protein n=1 Tax=Cystoisospora suis TaxID=483139 RepID=A0A2C6L6X3_9APIC|nr:hypothetical protein CSUI_003079 [Cystoisospora suis]